LFAITSIAILLTLKNDELLQQFSESLFLTGKQGVIDCASKDCGIGKVGAISLFLLNKLWNAGCVAILSVINMA
jgi:hypothetical protein